MTNDQFPETRFDARAGLAARFDGPRFDLLLTGSGAFALQGRRR